MSALVGSRIAPLLGGAIRVALGGLWIQEAWVKYRAGFGAADIGLVAGSALSNSRVPEFYKAFARNILEPAAGFFGAAIPLLELLLGLALVLGVMLRLVVVGSTLTLLMYWFADQLIWQYPLMVALALPLLLRPVESSRISLEQGVRRFRDRRVG